MEATWSAPLPASGFSNNGTILPKPRCTRRAVLADRFGDCSETRHGTVISLMHARSWHGSASTAQIWTGIVEKKGPHPIRPVPVTIVSQSAASSEKHHARP